MSKRVSRSLSAQLLGGVLLSLAAAAAVFFLCFALGTQILDRTVYGEPFMDKMADRQFQSLQSYVTRERVTAKNLHRLNLWCSQKDQVALTIYQNDTVLYDSSVSAGENPVPEDFDPAWESPDREYALVLGDGTETRAFLYYYAEDILYYWVTILAGLISFGAFSLCFIAFVHRKLKDIKRLKRELDILAGGDLRYPVTVKGTDELGELASGVDQMRRSILAHQEAEEQMRSANSQLVTAMSHDLRTPLTSLLGYLELLDRRKYQSEEQLQHFIRQSLGKTLQIKDMADKLFEYFLVYSSEWESPDMETADADELFQQLWGEYAFSLENEGFPVERDFGELKGMVQVNLELLRRAFDNLYSNLRKYSDCAQPLRLACQREGAAARLELSNAISPQRDKKESTNIGLNTCRRILQYHGGTFRAEEAAGRFRVTVTLPLAEVQETIHG
ncbi:MAG: HAMP domain-containing histidine kinase [Oscillibacter sp.]|nr:HAMP domain-containing histidine kinase [Oscillibacter sp.]